MVKAKVKVKVKVKVIDEMVDRCGSPLWQR